MQKKLVELILRLLKEVDRIDHDAAAPNLGISDVYINRELEDIRAELESLLDL